MRIERDASRVEPQSKHEQRISASAVAVAPFVVQPSLVLMGECGEVEVERARVGGRRQEQVLATAAMQPNRDGGAEGATRVDFLADGESSQAATSMTTTVIAARVIGDELLSMRSSFPSSTGTARSPNSQAALVEMMGSDEGSAAKVTLRHPTLGTVELRVELRGDEVTVKFQPCSASTARLIAAGEQGLREALRGHGLALKQVITSTTKASKRSRRRPFNALHEEA